MSTDAAVAIEHVSKTYRPFPWLLRLFVRNQVYASVLALDDVSLAVGPAEICAVVGPNGAGKTTLFRLLAGLTTPDEGTIRVLGQDVARGPRQVRSHIGWMSSDDRSLFLRHTCRENLRFHGRLHGMSVEQLHAEIPEMLRLVGLVGVEARAVFALSRGQRARLQLARALLPRPPVLVLDEPTGTIDPVAAYELLELIREVVSDRGVATLLSSHRLEEIETLGSRVVLLDEGRLIFDGDLATLRMQLEGRGLDLVYGTREEADEVAELLSGRGYHVTRRDGGSVRIALRAGQTPGGVLTSLDSLVCGVRSIRSGDTPLRELLARTYGSTRRVVR